ncbi:MULTISPECIES: UDP-N-acetylglucosamine 1-carboxyvinyltransferase [unclassified Lactococcus]|uniref:UDP-N-acetylglucosamine 1-carboxyvinyltransferase n=1 Tax=unclassified Lactococcus TaxID=2643510 RepID=UPI0011C951C3|nr:MULTISPECIES: UDP-N-acetylglucosamine 1-carboxyvinyltransferase [unclassified Lactococcus]MQW22095.1 UDP-N-acetylglucosamine 1-carboxyvinyltransferase [Lactococcus sp. dk101]TXK45036.1 UDP-N-acetylglucosamine 1-carboxyvinyltransferase [Lactococcus sp. dk310]TXK51184.1 UDP-N-acetylglucosamine 1-carboxyvinyltransferase [Lactococcus sp. dk322]
MDKIIVKGGNTRLQGEVEIEGAKNAVLPLLAATLLPSEGEVVLSNVPILSDVFMMNNLVEHLGVDLAFDQEKKTIHAKAGKTIEIKAPYEYVSKMRASIVVMGPILARNGHARVSMPGGCSIGSRPIDLHLRGFELMGATITQNAGYIEAKADHLKGAQIYMDFPSVGATQNLIMAATLADGTTTLENAAREPEIVDLANLLNKMGANVKGAGTDTIIIKGVKSMHGAKHAVVQDRIEAGTFMVAAAMTHGNVLIKDAISEHNRPLISKLTEMGVKFTEEANGIRVVGPERLKATTVKTLPHPGFPTDMQSQMTAAQAVAEGESTMIETVFENRFQHLEEMRRMGLNVEITRNTALIEGTKQLQGAAVKSTDLRASAALILLGLVAQGQTEVFKLNHLDRGYYKFHEKLKALGANIERVKADENEED